MTTTAQRTESQNSSSAGTLANRWRTRLAGGVAAGALLLAAPLATVAATQPASVASSSSVMTVSGSAAGVESGLPTTITLTARRAGSVTA